MGERLGTSQEFTSTDLAEVKNRKIPYFSLMILKNKIKKMKITVAGIGPGRRKPMYCL